MVAPESFPVSRLGPVNVIKEHLIRFKRGLSIDHSVWSTSLQVYFVTFPERQITEGSSTSHFKIDSLESL